MITSDKTILLTTANDQLTLELLDWQPALDIRIVGPRLPDLSASKQYWCFIDWILPEISGIEMCRRIRELPATQNAHITMLLGNADNDTRRRSIQAGADDYMTDILNAAGLFRRLQLDMHKPTVIENAKLVTLGNLQIDKSAYIVRYHGSRIALAMNELRLLIHFAENPNRVFTRARLIEMLGKEGENIDERTADVWIGRLRRAFKTHGAPDPLRTVRSVGYVLDHVDDEPVEVTSATNAPYQYGQNILI